MLNSPHAPVQWLAGAQPHLGSYYSHRFNSLLARIRAMGDTPCLGLLLCVLLSLSLPWFGSNSWGSPLTRTAILRAALLRTAGGSNLHCFLYQIGSDSNMGNWRVLSRADTSCGSANQSTWPGWTRSVPSNSTFPTKTRR